MADNYLLKEKIGQGGMGCVYRGETPDGRDVAIKMLECKYVSMPDFKEFFFIEANALKEMNHPSVVRFMGEPFSDEHGNLYLPMEYVEGETIEHRVKRAGPFSEEEARPLMCKILDAFDYIHGQAKIHRDIKPSNIMIRPNGGICVIDFGIAKDMKTSTGKTIGRCVGTDGYMSPEQVNGNSIDYRTDIYSLGCLLHFMLTGQHAITKQSSDYKTVVKILNEEFPSAKSIRPELSDDIQNIIYKAVDKNMLRRYQTAAIFKKALMGDNHSGGTRLSHCTTVTVGRGSSCDIVINNEYVSTNHLTINYKEDFASGPVLEFIDHSRNGTGINGRYVHNSSESVPFDVQMGASAAPTVMLAGREEAMLNMQDVLSLLGCTQKNKAVTTGPVDKVTSVKNPPTEVESASVGICILSLLFPIVGWILWAQWHLGKPSAARTVAILAWTGFAINVVSLILINL